ncbi:MAG: hypothetical protein ACREL5_02525 [Gemmatimonadales bacterium]
MPISRSVLLLALVAGFAGCRAPFESTTFTPPPPPPNAPLLPLRVGSTGSDFARVVATDGAGNAYVAGYFAGTVDFDAGPGATAKIANGPYDIAVAKYAPDGTFQWVFAVGGGDVDSPYAVKVAPDGAVYLAGYASAGALCNGSVIPNYGDRDILLVRISAAGTCDWAVSVGNTGDDEARDLAIDAAGDVLVAGSFTGTVDFDPGPATANLISRGGTDGFVARYGPDGSFIAVTQFGGTGDDAGTALSLQSNGDVVVGGTFSGIATFGSPLAPLLLTSEGGLDFFVAQLSNDLSLEWAARGGGAGNDLVSSGGVIAGSDGMDYVTGTFSGTATLGPGAGGQAIISKGDVDVFLTSYTAAGAWSGFQRTFGGTGTESVSAFAQDGAGNFYLGGSFQGSVDFDPGGSAHVVNALATSGATDAYLLSLNATGDFRWVNPLSAPVTGDGMLAVTGGVALAGDGSLWAVGRFYGAVDFDPGQDAVVRQSLGDSDWFVVRYLQTTGGITGQ